MNIINVKVNFKNGTCETTGINLITGDYNSTKMVFTFDREDGTKVFEMKSPSEELVMVQEIQNNEIILYGEDENENIASIFTEEGKYIFEVSLYESESKLTSAKGQIKVKPEQVVIDGEVVEAYLPIFDQLLTQVNTAITETNNLNITGSKEEHTTTITITKKDGTTQELQVLDGEKGDKGDTGAPGAVKAIKVNELPTENIQTDAMYLVPSTTPGTSNLYDEYMYIDEEWEIVGRNITIDLQDYVKNTDYATYSKGGVIKVDSAYGVQVLNGFLLGANKGYANYQSAETNLFITKGTLENVITGKGLVSNTDYASGTGGVVKINGTYALGISGSGFPYVNTKTYAQYESLDNGSFIGKGTLENVLTNRIGDISSVIDAINGESI